MLQFKTDRSLLKVLLLSFITCGIYAFFFCAKIGDDINIIASRRDGRKTMNYWLLVFIVCPLTCGIGALIWYNNLSERIGNEARARGIATNFGSGTYWIWSVLGSFLCFIGPLVYIHKLCETMNAISADYNARGI